MIMTEHLKNAHNSAHSFFHFMMVARNG